MIMKKIIIATTFITSLAAFNLENPGKAFKKLYALEGTWKMSSKRAVVFEEWKKLNKNHLQGRSYRLRNNDTVVSEIISLTNTKNGIIYTSVVEDQNQKQPIAFKMTKGEDNMFVFENQAHDFPKRIVYRFVTADSLHAFIDDGTEAGKKQNFYYKRL